MTILPNEKIYVLVDVKTGLPYGGTGRGYSKYRPLVRPTLKEAQASARAVESNGVKIRIDTYVRTYEDERK